MRTSVRTFQFIQWAVFIGCLILNSVVGISSELKEKPAGWQVDAIPVVLSEFYYGHPADFTMLAQVKEVFHQNTGARDASGMCNAIQAAKSIPLNELDRSKISVLSNDDKGIVDYVKLSFWIFGEKTAGFFYLYMLLLISSALIFMLRFTKNQWPPILLFCLLVAHAAMIPIAAINPQIQNLYSPRFISVLGLFPLLHLLCLMFGPPKSSKRLLALDFFQCLLLLFLAYVRLTALSQIVGLVAIFLGYSVFIALSNWKKERNIQKRLSVLPIRALLPVLVLMLGVFANHFILDFKTSSAYRQKPNIVRRVMWHNLLSGLAFQPELQSRYQLKIDDVSVIAATGRWLKENGRKNEWENMGGGSEGFSRIAWTPYDAACGEVFRDIIQKHPWKVFSSVVFYKPIAFAKEMLWHMGFSKNYPHMHLLHPNHASQMKDMEKNILNNPLRLASIPAFLIVVLGGLIIGRLDKKVLIKYASASAILFLISTAPILIGYPLSQSIGETAVGFITLIYAVFALLLAWLFQKIRLIKPLP